MKTITSRWKGGRRWMRAGLMVAIGFGCKPAGTGSRLYETGGTPETGWRVKAYLSEDGALRVERVSAASGAAVAPTDGLKVTSVAIEPSQVGRDSVMTEAGLSSGQFQDLLPAAGTAGGQLDTRVNLLLHMSDGRLCYANDIQLNGSNEAVACKADTGEVPGQPGVSSQMPPGAGPASFQSLTGTVAVTAASDPAQTCRELMTRACALGGVAGYVAPETEGCRCGSVLYRFQDFQGRADRLASDCQTAARIAPTSLQITTGTQRPWTGCP